MSLLFSHKPNRLSLFYTFGGPEKDLDLNYIHSFIYKVYFTELYYKHIIYKVIFTNIPKLSQSNFSLYCSNLVEFNTKYYVKRKSPTFVPTLGTYFLCSHNFISFYIHYKHIIYKVIFTNIPKLSQSNFSFLAPIL